ncbi:hypothetical protein CY34DRAFT_13867 [Suillus luteus UH-Slu-Lm8-n1]|uniref:Uncharacterized protein n=1 Tax=Suillus luteus UH-Slu-Lm8-n1 TaxID=930992 RepID=A0A0C9ZR45_9AGAM|nr:hypothetical protein CY34DRAFT_13867 [Suillus luteus UH-Slu-Lm8-n1]
MADNAGIVVHKTPTRNSALTANSEAGLRYTPLAVGSTAVSEHINSVGVEVNNLRSWITRDVLNFEKCEADMTLQELGPKDTEQGSRVLYIIVFRKLILITTLSSKEFLAAWRQIVKCHRALWKGGVFH